MPRRGGVGDIWGLRGGQADLAKLDFAPLFRARFGAAAADRPARGFLAQKDSGRAAHRRDRYRIDFTCARRPRARLGEWVAGRGGARGGDGRSAKKGSGERITGRTEPGSASGVRARCARPRGAARPGRPVGRRRARRRGPTRPESGAAARGRGGAPPCRAIGAPRTMALG